MLRREGDGATWMFERVQLLAGTPAPPCLLAAWVTSGEEAHTAALLETVVAFVEAAPIAFPTTGVKRRQALSAEGFNVKPQRWNDGSYRTAIDRLADPASTIILTWDGVSLDLDREESSPLWRWVLVTLPPDGALDAAAAAWSGLLPLLARHGSVDWGGVYFDRAVRRATPHEKWLGISDGARSAAQHPRHYCWSNLLTAEHIAGLGGPAQLERRGTEYGLRVLPIPGVDPGVAAVVDTGAPISQFDDGKLAAMKGFLDPVLRQKPYKWYGELPIRVVKEPGTAYRHIPPEIAIPWFDDDPPIPPGSGTGRQLVPDN